MAGVVRMKLTEALVAFEDAEGNEMILSIPDIITIVRSKHSIKFFNVAGEYKVHPAAAVKEADFQRLLKIWNAAVKAAYHEYHE